MKLRIISNGIPFGTRVVNTETGLDVPGVTKITYVADIKDNLCRCTIETIDTAIDAVGECENSEKE